MPERLLHIGNVLRTRLQGFFDYSLDADANPLEIRHAVLDELERKVQPIGRGRRVFPFNRVVIRVKESQDGRPALEAAFGGMDLRLKERLTELQCEIPESLEVKIAFTRKAPADWPPGRLYSIDLHVQPDAAPVRQAEPAPRSLSVTVVKGCATQEVYTLTDRILSIGRTPEPVDEMGRLRRNHVAFLDAVDGVTETVGRAHARLQFDSAAGEYRLFDEGSSNGTFIVRDGHTISVPPRDPRGVRVRPGDEIQLGRALIRLAEA